MRVGAAATSTEVKAETNNIATVWNERHQASFPRLVPQSISS